MRKWILIGVLLSFPVVIHAEPFLLATHLIINGFASKYLPGYKPTSYHGAYVGVSFATKYERNDAYKTNRDSEGSSKGGSGYYLGYHFIRSESHRFGIEIHRSFVDYKDETNKEDEDTIDGIGLRLSWGVVAFKLGYATHGFKNEADYWDNGMYTGFGLDLGFGNWGVFMELTDYLLRDRDKHLAGFDFGIRYLFDGTSAGSVE